MELDFDTPILPYAGTSGWSGSETSKERAVRNDESGTTNARQLKVYNMARRERRLGITWTEVAQELEVHHGSASNVLSVLDKTGVLVRLKERRNGCAIYVLPEWVMKREVAVRKVKSCKHCGGKL